MPPGWHSKLELFPLRCWKKKNKTILNKIQTVRAAILGLSCWSSKTSGHPELEKVSLSSHPQRSSRSAAAGKVLWQIGVVLLMWTLPLDWLLYTRSHQIKECGIAVSPPKRNLPDTSFSAGDVCYIECQPLWQPVCLPASFSQSICTQAVTVWIPSLILSRGLRSSVWSSDNPCLVKNEWINKWKFIHQQRHDVFCLMFLTFSCI